MPRATATITIDVPAARVWQALTDQQLAKQYGFGATVTSDWKKGSAITYQGEWDGKPYEDKGQVLEVKPNQLLKSTYFSSLSGQEDVPENYQIVTYTLSEAEGKTKLIVTQDNIKEQAYVEHYVANWNMVLTSMKTLLEQ